jgi:D-aminopeptidase
VLSQIDDVLASAADANAPGIAIGISRGGTLLHTAARGLANLASQTPFTPQTPFRICSISKQFCCALVWRLIRAGQVKRDAHPGTYVPWMRVFDPRLTIRHLMQNQSGIRDQWVMAMLMGAKPADRFTLNEGFDVMRRAHESMFAPGSQSLYCNGNFELLGAVLEAASGERFAYAVARHIFRPLGMADSFVGIDTAASLPTDARGYRHVDGAWEEEVNRIEWSASAGVVSTIEDLLKWEAALRDPRARGLPWVADIQEPGHFNDGAPAVYASGISHLRGTQGAMLIHGGALRGWRSVLCRYVHADTAIAIFMNRTNSPAGPLPRGVLSALEKVLSIPPPWPSHSRDTHSASLQRGACGTFVSREQGILVQIDGADAAPTLSVSGMRSPLTPHGDMWVDDENDASVMWESRDVLRLHLREANVHTRCMRVDSDGAAGFDAAGRWACGPVAATAQIDRHRNGAFTIHFSGPCGEGRGESYPLHLLDAHTAWFEIARGVDESPPGQVLLIHDADAGTIELSASLARRIVFRRT